MKLDLAHATVRLTDAGLQRARDVFYCTAVAGWLEDGALGILRPDRVEFTCVISRHADAIADDLIGLLYVPRMTEAAR